MHKIIVFFFRNSIVALKMGWNSALKVVENTALKIGENVSLKVGVFKLNDVITINE